MTILVKIIKLTSDELIIEPIRNTEVHDKRPLYRPLDRDLSVELRQLKIELAQAHQLQEKVDYTEVPIERSYWNYDNYGPYHLKFSGKSAVLRALSTIPALRINFTSQSYPLYTAINYQEARYRYATQISEKECTAFDMKFVKQAYLDLYNYLNDQIKEIHDKSTPHSAIIRELIANLEYIKELQSEECATPKYMLALSSLQYALTRELAERQTVASYRVMKGDSILAPKYQQLIYKIYAISTHADQLKERGLLDIYTKQVAARTILKSAKPTDQAADTIGFAAVMANYSTSARLLTEAKQAELAKVMSNEKFASNFFQALKINLNDRKTAIQKRINHHQWFQDYTKNSAKIAAIKEITEAIDAGKNATELCGLIRVKRNVLTQSTSTLPMFFRGKVSTTDLLKGYEKFLVL